jgi:O-antigen ligase
MPNEYEQLENPAAAHLAALDAAPAERSRTNTVAFVALCAIPIFANLAYGAVETWSFGFVSLLTGVLALLWLADAWAKREFSYHTSLLQLPLLGLTAIGLIQLLPVRSAEIPDGALRAAPVSSLSINPYATRIAVVQLIVYFVFLAAAYVFLDDYRRLKKAVGLIIVFGALMAFFGILQRLADVETIYGWRRTPQAIPFASFVNQHHFAAFMELTIGLTLALLVGQGTEKDKRLLLVIAAVLMGIALLLTGSRGGVLSLLGVLGFLLVGNFLRRRENAEGDGKEDKRARFRRSLAVVGGSLALLLVLFGAVVLLGGDDSLLRGVGLTNQTDVSSGRTHFWGIALRIFQDYPILGAGLDAFGTAYPRYDSWNGAYRVEQAHNDYLQILADAGILGFACLAAFIFLLFRQGLALIAVSHDPYRRSVATGALAGCFGILLHSFFDFPLRTPANAFFFLLFAVLATAAIATPKHHRRKRK